MANIHLIGGEKGGVGKSVVARLLAQYCIDRSIPFLGFDADRSHGALMRFYADYASPVLVDRYESLDAIVESATDNPERRILVDLAAQADEPLTQWMEESQLLEVAREIGLNIRYWHVMDTGRDSVDLLRRLFDRYGQRLSFGAGGQDALDRPVRRVPGRERLGAGGFQPGRVAPVGQPDHALG